MASPERSDMHRLTLISAHNFYRSPGGEDRVFASEAALLKAHAHSLCLHERHNTHLRSPSVAAFTATWNVETYREIRTAARSRQVAHFHNTFPLLSPSVYYAAAAAGCAIVQTLHNFRLICPGSLLARDCAPCEDCVASGTLLPAIKHACYRNSRAATAAVVTMLSLHRAAGTYTNMVDAYIALSQFARQKFVAGGLPSERLFVKPNFVDPDPGAGRGTGGYALYAGRLSREKGVATLAEAWRRLNHIPLRVAGDGPLRNAPWPAGVTTFGGLPHNSTLALLREAAMLVFPSTCYECCPMAILESLACGTPVIASNLGSIPEFVRHGYNGLLFRPGDPQDLARQVRWAFEHPEELRVMRANARREFEEKYTAERNYKMLMAIYEQAIENAHRRRAKKAAT